MPLHQRICTFGFPLLDEIMGGIEVGDLVILQGATGTGKSAFGRHLLNHWRQTGMAAYVVDTQQHSSTTAMMLDALAAGVSPRDHLHEALNDAQMASVQARRLAQDLPAVEIRSDGAGAVAELERRAATGAV
ncbi:MAG: hypothetical protein H7338_00510, partial [Candidatus Sericytochromatia bacterium]|nr:hypothetical protein [Candidatus Sericytochromatia bacterium]